VLSQLPARARKGFCSLFFFSFYLLLFLVFFVFSFPSLTSYLRRNISSSLPDATFSRRGGEVEKKREREREREIDREGEKV